MNFDTRLEYLQVFDLEPIVFKLTHHEDGEGWTLERADSGVREYRRFLELCLLYPHEAIVPTKEVDEVWHKHILDTGKYREDCEIIFGYILDHFPYFGVRSEDDARDLQNAFRSTKELYRKQFGEEMPVSMSVACGPSCKGSLCDNNACDSNSCTPSISRTRPRPDRLDDQPGFIVF